MTRDWVPSLDHFFSAQIVCHGAANNAVVGDSSEKRPRYNNVLNSLLLATRDVNRNGVQSVSMEIPIFMGMLSAF
ncbi:hypothetical protein DPMN_117138 [Dreissena polymorpha]|uniref:Uncharacterized protein n=1 Tax=Dreissena polymorpha TaxID=45954 RepID=A0A9D4QVD7_DREPO|nr:hypothetical protein DPMN_117138 [Dreissena polymorpha]